MFVTLQMNDFTISKGSRKDFNKTQKAIEKYGIDEFEYVINQELNDEVTFNSELSNNIGVILLDYNNNISGLPMDEFIVFLLDIIKFIGQEDIILTHLKDIHERLTYKMVKTLITGARWQETAQCICSFNDNYNDIDKYEKLNFVFRFSNSELYNLLNKDERDNVLQEDFECKNTVLPESFIYDYLEEVIAALVKTTENDKYLMLDSALCTINHMIMINKENDENIF